ncbi:MAG: 6-phosphogluconolactonase, partial [Armatimonadota bacterium]
MESDVRGDVRVYPDPPALALAAAPALVDTLLSHLAGAGRCSIALAGGTTPRALYRLLGSTFRQAVPWEKVHVFWSDER